MNVCLPAEFKVNPRISEVRFGAGADQNCFHSVGISTLLHFLIYRFYFKSCFAGWVVYHKFGSPPDLILGSCEIFELGWELLEKWVCHGGTSTIWIVTQKKNAQRIQYDFFLGNMRGPAWFSSTFSANVSSKNEKQQMSFDTHTFIKNKRIRTQFDPLRSVNLWEFQLNPGHWSSNFSQFDLQSCTSFVICLIIITKWGRQFAKCMAKILNFVLHFLVMINKVILEICTNFT